MDSLLHFVFPVFIHTIIFSTLTGWCLSILINDMLCYEECNILLVLLDSVSSAATSVLCSALECFRFTGGKCFPSEVFDCKLKLNSSVYIEIAGLISYTTFTYISIT